VLGGWSAPPPPRRDIAGDGEYDHAVAVAIGDATLVPMLDAVFGEELAGADLPQRVQDHPDQGLGSAYNGGRANFLHKDFRQALGRTVEGPRSRTYCGGGSLEACRAALWDALDAAAGALADEYESVDVDDWTYDARRDDIVQSAVGVTTVPDMRWQNRPTYQQVVQVGGPRPSIERVSGERRFETAVAVSRTRYDEADTVVLARADRYPDALAGAPLARQLDAPLLLTNHDELNEATAEEIERLGASEAVLLGGTAAIADAVRAELLVRGVASRRVGGADRFDTAVEIARELDADSGSAFLVEGGHDDPGRGWPDALAAAPYAAFTERPILLTLADELPEATADGLAELEITETVVVGGARAVSPEVVAEVDEAGHGPRRIDGADRYATSVAVWREAVAAGMDGAHVWLATGLTFPDALSAGPTVAAHGHSLLLVHGTDLSRSPATQALLRAEAGRLESLRLLGGTAAISTAVARAITSEVR
jgi:hypothetical protein